MLLTSIREGNVSKDQLACLQSRVLLPGAVNLNVPLNSVSVIVHRNLERICLYTRFSQFFAQASYSVVTWFPAHDTVSKTLTPALYRELLLYPEGKSCGMPTLLPLVVGLPVILRVNIATELGLFNGQSGHVQGNQRLG